MSADELSSPDADPSEADRSDDVDRPATETDAVTEDAGRDAAESGETGDHAPEADAETATAPVDLDAMTADLDAVDAALVRLADDTYWTDEVTGEPLPHDLLEANPLARRR